LFQKRHCSAGPNGDADIKPQRSGGTISDGPGPDKLSTTVGLGGAHLEGAELEGARGMTQEQVDSAIGDATTQLPAGIIRLASWTKKAS
jgi:hypothetical protein